MRRLDRYPKSARAKVAGMHWLLWLCKWQAVDWGPLLSLSNVAGRHDAPRRAQALVYLLPLEILGLLENPRSPPLDWFFEARNSATSSVFAPPSAIL